ncbi:uncharacterized protein LOC131998054 [Stomoxys calcitrans]|uniref:uncharacterized protein LOC131998054 n=1 Tax=Stomoxys calcitrans TaxID=35570 RepID=UPI0027E28439|nr:uncharacterized protein LOC131998054 [Stomoxys calcitrans]
MNCNVGEVDASTSQNKNNLGAQPNVYKRQRTENESDYNEIVIPELRERLKRHKQTDDNPFGILNVLTQVDFASAATQATQPDTDNKNKNNNNINNNNSATRPKWCPPIFIYNVNIKALVDSLRETIPKFSFKVKNVNKNKSKLFFSDPSVHSSMMALLREKGVHSYSFTKELKRPSFVLRGLTANTEIEDIISELEEVIPNTVSNVAKYKTPKNNETRLFLVSLLPGKKISDISNIKALQSQIVSWENQGGRTMKFNVGGVSVGATLQKIVVRHTIVSNATKNMARVNANVQRRIHRIPFVIIAVRRVIQRIGGDVLLIRNMLLRVSKG